MNKLIFTIGCLMVLINSAWAQRDIKVVLVNPKQGDSLVNKTPFNVTVHFINVGDTPLMPADTFFVSYYLNNFKVITGPGMTYTIREVLEQPLLPGDTLTKDFGNMSFDLSLAKIVQRFCVGVVLNNEAIDQMNNNAGCADMNSYWRTGLNQALLSVDAAVYPNPASHQVQVQLVPKTAYLRLIDVLGREVLFTDLPENQAEWSVNLEQIPTGIYTLIWLDEYEIPLAKALLQKK